MILLAKLRRKDAAGGVVYVYVNPDKVCSVQPEAGGAYIVTADELNAEKDFVTPVGISSPDAMKQVKRRLNRPYYIDISIRLGGMFFSLSAILAAIMLKENQGGVE